MNAEMLLMDNEQWTIDNAGSAFGGFIVNYPLFIIHWYPSRLSWRLGVLAFHSNEFLLHVLDIFADTAIVP